MRAPSYNKTVWDDIKRYDPALELQWNYRANRWELWRKGKQRRMFIVRIENDDGTFRPLDKRLLGYLVDCDGWKKHGGNATAIHKELLDYERQERARKDRELYGKLEEVSDSQYAKKIISDTF